MPSRAGFNAFLIAIAFIASGPLRSAAQPAHWTWTQGPKGPNTGSAPVYGELNLPAKSNTPGDRDSAVTWMDVYGDLWLLGGEGHDAAGARVVYGDLWQYSLISGAWIWEGGTTSNAGQKGVYGTLKTPGKSNMPGSRYGAATWIDSQFNVWVFGGWGYDSTGAAGYLNDLWALGATSGEWAWMGGSDTIGKGGGQPGVYGTVGKVSAANMPGARIYAAAWTDGDGDVWLFGGDAFDSEGKQGNLNDFWAFSQTTGEWTWMGGSDKLGAPNGTPGSYGKLNIGASTNIPGGRYGAHAWFDPDLNLWLFGGIGVTTSGNYGYLNDLWLYNGEQWIWMNGSSTVNSKGYAPADYGTQGSEAISNTPGGRANGVAWTDANNNQWLVGGIGADADGNVGSLNDLWTLDSNHGAWVWMGGSKSANSTGTYGTLGTGSPDNEPPGRENALGWSGAFGDLAIYGGEFNTGASTRGYLDDLWLFTAEIPPVSPASATLSANSISVSSYVGSYNAQGGVTITDEGNGSLYVGSIGITGPGAAAWALQANYPCPPPLSISHSCNIGVTFTPPEAKTYSAVLSINDNATNSPQTVQLTGKGVAIPVYPTTTTLTASAAKITYGSSLVLTANVSNAAGVSNPNGRYGSVTFYDGSELAGSSYMSEGQAVTWSTDALTPGEHTFTANYPGDTFDDPSKSNAVTVTVSLPTSEPSYNWIWLGGPGTPSNGILPEFPGLVYESTSYEPGDRASALTWMDDSGNFYLFGGIGYAESGVAGLLSDTWTFTPSRGTWYCICDPGTTYFTPNEPGRYGININPGSRYGAAHWTDNLGKVWMFGGFGYDSTGAAGYLNDLWTFPNGWSWIGGSSTIGSAKGLPGVYGSLGTPAAKNIPGSRVYAASWTDSQHQFWLFGGYGYDANGAAGYLNDLWMYNSSSGEWTWEGGDDKLGSSKGAAGVYGSKGSASATNLPGGRSGAFQWTDWKGNFWLFGGEGVTTAQDSKPGYLNDLWMYSPASHKWTWVNGSTAVNSNGNQLGDFGKLGDSSASNIPGGRTNGTAWIDFEGRLWLFGGTGIDSKGDSRYLGDQWMFNPSAGQWTWERGSSLANSLGNTGTQGVAAAANYPGARGQPSYWSGLDGGVWMYGGLGNTSQTAQADYADLWTYSPELTPAEAPVVQFSVPALHFRWQGNVESPPQVVTLTNTGTAPLTIDSIGFKGYIEGLRGSNTCNGPVAVGSSCTISVELDSVDVTSPDIANYSLLTVKDNAWNSPQSVGLIGTATTAPWIATTTTLTASTTEAAAGATVTFTGTVKAASGVPTGKVSFYDGIYLIGWIKLNGAGVATLSTNQLEPGTHSITAGYDSDSTHTNSTSAVTTLKVSAP
jgi:N-acetylneuraminic acid mutarotase